MLLHKNVVISIKKLPAWHEKEILTYQVIDILVFDGQSMLAVLFYKIVMSKKHDNRHAT